MSLRLIKIVSYNYLRNYNYNMVNLKLSPKRFINLIEINGTTNKRYFK